MTLTADAYTHDEALASAYVAGDDDAFDAFYQRYYPDLVGYLDRRVRDRVLAEELAQETCVQAFVGRHTFDPSRPMWPWLKKIAFHVLCADGRRRQREVLVDQVFAPDSPVGDIAELSAERTALIESLARIPLRQRRALVLHYLEDRDLAEVARSFGLKKGAFEQLLHRARRNLAQAYGNDTLTLRERAGLAVLPALLRLRRIANAVDAKVSAVAQATLPIAANVAVGTAAFLGGAAALGSAATAAAAPAPVWSDSAPLPRPEMHLAARPEVVRAQPVASAARPATLAAPIAVPTPTATNAPAPPAAGPSQATEPVPTLSPAPDGVDGDGDIEVSAQPEGVPGSPDVGVKTSTDSPGSTEGKAIATLPIVGPVGPTTSGHTEGEGSQICWELVGICTPQ